MIGEYHLLNAPLVTFSFAETLHYRGTEKVSRHFEIPSLPGKDFWLTLRGPAQVVAATLPSFIFDSSQHRTELPFRTRVSGD